MVRRRATPCVTLMHMPARTTALRWGAQRFLGLPQGAGILFSPSARLRLAFALTGILAISGLEIAALAALVPLMQLLSGASVGSPIMTALTDATSGMSSGSLTAALAVLVLTLYVTKAVITLIFRWWMLGLMAREQISVSEKLFDYYLRAPYTLHLRRNTPDLLSTMNDAVGQTYGLVVTGSLMAVSDLITILAVVLTLVVIFPLPTLSAVAYLAIATVIFQWWAKPRMLTIGEDLLVAARIGFQSALEALGTVKDILIRGSQEHFVRGYTQSRRLGASAQRRSAFMSELPKHLMEILFLLGIGLMTLVVFTTGDAKVAFSVIAVFAAAGLRVLPTVVRAIASINSVRVGRYSMDKVVTDLHDALDLPAAGRGPVTPQPFEHEVRLEKVCFTYDGSDLQVLRDVDITIPKGQTVALVGGSGAGKSTIADILLGLLTPRSGVVTVDGVDVRTNLAGWQRHLGMVPQLVWLLDGTVRDNVAYGQDREDIDDAAVWAALDQAHLGGTIRALPQQLDAPGGERGMRLSGGQRQRLGIARALYGHPDLLVLDEATSALDNETERRITETIAELSDAVTVVVIAHRLSTVRHADKIVFLEDGRVAGTGTFEELRATVPAFAHLVELGELA